MAKKKIYAVRKGYKTGLFYTWDECKKAVYGYSGAEYKGFLTKEEAEAFLNIGAAKIITNKNSSTTTSVDFTALTTSTSDRLVVYVDGSFDVSIQKYSFGCVILLEDGRIIERSGKERSRNYWRFVMWPERCMVRCMRYSGHLKWVILCCYSLRL